MRIVDLHLAQHEVRAVAGDGTAVTHRVPVDASPEQLNAAGLEAVQSLLGEDAQEVLVRVHANGAQFIMRADGGVLVPAPEFEQEIAGDAEEDAEDAPQEEASTSQEPEETTQETTQPEAPEAPVVPAEQDQVSPAPVAAVPADPRADEAASEPQAEDDTSPAGEQPATKDRGGNRRRVVLFAAGGALVLLVVLVLAVSLLVSRLGTGTSGDDQQDQSSAAPTALAQEAPVGWTSTVAWSVSANQAGAVAGDGKITYGDGNEVVTVDEDFQEVSRTDLGTRVASIEEAPGLGDEVITARGSGGQVWIGAAGDQLHQIEAPKGAAEPTWFSGIPVYSTASATYVPDSSGKLTRYATADGKPVAVVSGRLWFISTTKDETPKAWVISSDDEKAPEPVKLPTPAGDAKYTGQVTGVGEHAGLVFTSGKDSLVEVLKLGDDGKVSDARAVKTTEGETTADAAHDLLLSGGTLIDVSDSKAMSVGKNGELAAGAFWATGADAKRVTADGDVQAWPAGKNPDPVIPAAVDSQGRALVIVPEDDGKDSRLYVLEKEDKS